MKRLLVSLTLCTLLSSCGAIIDKAGARTEQLIEKVAPKIIESVLNSDSIAFLIVSVVGLGIIVVLVALWLLIGTTRAWWKRIQLKKCSK